MHMTPHVPVIVATRNMPTMVRMDVSAMVHMGMHVVMAVEHMLVAEHMVMMVELVTMEDTVVARGAPTSLVVNRMTVASMSPHPRPMGGVVVHVPNAMARDRMPPDSCPMMMGGLPVGALMMGSRPMRMHVHVMRARVPVEPSMVGRRTPTPLVMSAPSMANVGPDANVMGAMPPVRHPMVPRVTAVVSAVAPMPMTEVLAHVATEHHLGPAPRCRPGRRVCVLALFTRLLRSRRGSRFRRGLRPALGTSQMTRR